MVRELFVMARSDPITIQIENLGFFAILREHAPSIIFMDEIDSIGSSRVEGSHGGKLNFWHLPICSIFILSFFLNFFTGDSEVQRTMLELLNQLDGFEPTKNIKVIMATNRIDILDPALLRPGDYQF